MTKFDPTKPVQTRDGRPARILATDLRDPSCPLAVAVVAPGGNTEDVHAYGADGAFRPDVPGSSSSWDLINIPVKREGWVNLYRHSSGTPYPGATIHPDEATAKRKAEELGAISCVRLEWEE